MTGSAPLDGVVVVSLEQAVAAPLASQRLADAGARVIKIERAEGDFARGYDNAADGASAYFAWLNRGKESIALDVKDADDRSLLLRILSTADVFIQNLAVGATTRLGLDAASLHAVNPRLIVCDLSGYGSDGPMAEMKAYDLLVQAESGILAVSGPPGPYGRVGVSLVDLTTGMNAAIAITQALYRQARTGEGAHLETSLFASAAELMTVPLVHHEGLGKAPERVGLAHPSISPYGGFESSDGHTVVISIQSDREWRDLCEQVLDRPELGTDERFATNVVRVANRPDTDGIVASVFARTTRDELTSRLLAARIAYGAVNDVAALSAHPQLRRIAAPHADGIASLPAPPVATDWDVEQTVPSVDQHGDSIRAEFG
ncbi:MAG: itaconate CoA-transferase [Acidimicrobiales bacterium]|jgi:itaconate CoA-transferase